MCEFMKQALLQAKKAKKQGEVPVGAVIVKGEKIISKAYNTREMTQNALCHAEILAIEKACKKLHTFRLTDCTLYVTLEPCPMCTGAIINARVGQVFVGCKDKEFGCCGGKINIAKGDFGFSPQVEFGVMESECKALLDDFFEKIREKNKLKKLLGKTIDMHLLGEKAYYLYDKDKIECILETSCKNNSTFENGNLTTKAIFASHVESKKTTKTNNLCCVDSKSTTETNIACHIDKKKTNETNVNCCGNVNTLLNKDTSLNKKCKWNVAEKSFICSQQKVFAIIDELMTGKIYFICRDFDERERLSVLKNLKLKGRVKIFEVGKEPIIFDIKNLTKGDKSN